MAQHGDLYGESFQAKQKLAELNRDVRTAAVNRINENDGIRYVDLPGGGQWPVPTELAELTGLE